MAPAFVFTVLWNINVSKAEIHKKYKTAYKSLYSSPEKQETMHYPNIQILKICTNLIIAN